MIFAKDQPTPNDDSITASTVVQLTDEAKVKMTALLDALSNVVDCTVTGDDLAAALRSLREQDGVAFDPGQPDQLPLLIARLKDMKNGSD